MAKGSFAFRHAHAKARVLAPIDTDGLTLADVPALRDRTRDDDRFGAARAPARARRGARMTAATGAPAELPRDEDELEERLSRPTAALTAVLATVPGDVARARRRREDGASLARMARRAPIRRAA